MNKEHIAAQIVLRAWPFLNGSGRITDRLFANLKFSEKVAEVETSDGFKLSVFPNDLIGRHIYLTGKFDRTTVEVLVGLAKPGDTLLDIGANIGYVSASFLANVTNSTVIAVEPQPLVVDLLVQNLSQFSDRASIYPVALSDEDGTIGFHIDQRNLGASRVSADGDCRIEAWSGETFIRNSSPNKIDLIKIDVEGHELQVLSALRGAIGQHRPRAILFEDLAFRAAPSGPIGSLMRDIGYEVFVIVKTLNGFKMRPVLSEMDCVSIDYLATRRPD